MAKMKLKVTGFDEMLAEINRAGGDIERAGKDCMQKSVKELERSLKQEAAASGAETSEVKSTVTQDGTRIKGETGWELGEYNSRNPSEGYRAMFVEFGTGQAKPRRTAKGWNRGSTAPRPFLAKARKKAAPKIKKIQKETFDDILKGLGR